MKEKLSKRHFRRLITLFVLFFCCITGVRAQSDYGINMVGGNGLSISYESGAKRFKIVLPVMYKPNSGDYVYLYHSDTHPSLLKFKVNGGAEMEVLSRILSYSEVGNPCQITFVPVGGRGKYTDANGNAFTAGGRNVITVAEPGKGETAKMVVYWYPAAEFWNQQIDFVWYAKMHKHGGLTATCSSPDYERSTTKTGGKLNLPNVGSVSITDIDGAVSSSQATLYNQHMGNNVLERYVTVTYQIKNNSEIKDFIDRGGHVYIYGEDCSSLNSKTVKFYYKSISDGDSKPKTDNIEVYPVVLGYGDRSATIAAKNNKFNVSAIQGINWLQLYNEGGGEHSPVDGVVELLWSSYVQKLPVVIERSFNGTTWERLFSGIPAYSRNYLDNGLAAAAQKANVYDKVYYRASLKYDEKWLFKSGSMYATKSIAPTFKHKYVTSISATAGDGNNSVVIYLDNATNRIWSTGSKVVLQCSVDDGSWQNIDDALSPTKDTIKVIHSVDNCHIYKYRAMVVTGNKNFADQYGYISSTPVTPSNNKSFEYLSASKGYYNNYVEIQWEIEDNTAFTEFEVKRRMASQSKSDDWITIENVSRKEGSLQKVFRVTDQSCLPGVVYEYIVEGMTTCGEGRLSATTNSDFGFRSPSGAFSGRVTYGNGQSVDSVYVRASTDDNIETYAMSFSGNGYLSIDDATLLSQANTNLTLQAWVSAKQGGGEIMSKGNMFKLYLTSDSKPCFKYGNSTVTATESVNSEYNHITAVASFTNHKISIYINGVLNNSAVISDKNVNASNDLVKIGTGFNGEIDEVRIWSDTLPDNSISKDYMRYLAPGKEEKNLEAYYTFNFVTNMRFFDCSSNGDGTFNGRNGSITNVSKSPHVPTLSQLSYMALTDNEGKYNIVGVPYLGNGTTYTITPSKGTHVFNPNNEVRFINESASNHTINFTDESSFLVDGYVYYENTDYPVEGVNLYVDGIICSNNGELVQTDANGHYEISVPIGSHYISVGKVNHTFVSGGRFPKDEYNAGNTYVFIKPLTNLVFYDNTYVTLTGRVTGGTEQEVKPFGLAQSVANIGQAVIELQSFGNSYKFNTGDTVRKFANVTSDVNSAATSGAGSNIISIKTDPVTGEYAVKLPPVDFHVNKVTIPGNDEVVFDASKYEPIKLSEVLSMTKTDSVLVDGKYKHFSYEESFNATYRTSPTLEVIQNGEAFGDAKYNYVDKANNIDTTLALYTVNEDFSVDYTFGLPVFRQGSNYVFNIYGYEEYVNKDNANMYVVDKVPMKNVVVTVKNELGTQKIVALEDKEADNGTAANRGEIVDLTDEQVMLDSTGRARYSFIASFPNINEQDGFALGINISYENNGELMSWPESGNSWKGIIFGGLPTGNNFTTAGPDNVHFILRDPPGTGSSAYLEEGTTITKKQSYQSKYSGSEDISSETKLGMTVGTWQGISVGIYAETDYDNTVTAGTSIEQSVTNGTELSSTITLNQKISTSEEMNYVGSAGDIFIGRATNIVFGSERTVRPQYNAETNSFNIELNDGLSASAEFSTEFKHTQNYVENVLIPDLKDLRRSLLRNHRAIDANMKNHLGYSMYFYSDADFEDEDFGSDTTKYKWIAPLDKSGHVIDCQDSVVWYTQQISLWNKLLAQNEAMKVMAIENTANYDEARYNAALEKFNFVHEAYKAITNGEHNLSYYTNSTMLDVPFTEAEYNIYKEAMKDTTKAVSSALFYDGGYKKTNHSFDSGTSIESSVAYTSSVTESFELEFDMKVNLGLEHGFGLNGSGLTLTVSTTQGGGYSQSSETSTETSVEVGYTLAEDGDDDALTVDVYVAPDGFGPIFYTRAGQTSCPYEGEEVTKYFEPGKHKLAEATMRIEWPEIRVEEDVMSNIPAGDVANFTLKLQNNSEIHEDIWYQLRIEDGTNPDGAMVMVDGNSLTGFPLEVLVPAGETVYKTLSIEQSRIDVLDYENIGVILASSCQYDGTDIFDVIADTVHVSVQFAPSCSDITLQIENPIVNTVTGDTLPIVLTDYNVNYGTFKSIRLQYRGEGDANWNTIKTFMKENINGYRIDYGCPMRDMADNKYQFRAITVCDFGSGEVYNESETIDVVKDMSKPASLGVPSPINGILTNENEIFVQFNEPIQSGKLRSDIYGNFVVEGVLNGYELDHAAALNLQGDEAYTEAGIDLSDRDFTFEMWLNYTKPGTLIEHGVGQNRFKAEITDDNKLRLTMGEKVITSDNALLEDYWMYLAISYDKSHETVSASYAYDAATVNLFENEAMASYSGNGPLTIGKDMNVKMHELTLWDENRNFVTSTSEMNTAKYPSTWNLIGYWPLDEGKGTVGADNARSRNLVLPANAWYLNNVNFAAAFNGDNSYIKVNTSSIPVKDEQDYAVEFWFRAESAGTLFSAGDSLLAVGFDADKSMYIVADGKKSQVTAANYVDNTWHHFALNVLRNGTSAVYIDGNVARQLVSSNVPALAASDLVIGAMGNYEATGLYSGNMVYSDFFKGQVDEFRIWNATMTASALRMNIDNRISGDEPGLVAYYPFENTFVDSYNQNVTEYSTIDYVTAAKHDTDPSSAVLYAENVNVESTSQAPALKESRNVESVSFGYVASDTKIVINVTEDAARIEGRTLEFTVKNVIDANGNYCEPIHWTAYVNRNQLKWSDNSKSIKKELYDNYEFSVNIVNQSGNLENWTMTNLPTWLHASKTSGTLAALSSETIKFTVEESTAIGKYEETVYLTGNNNIDEPFVVSLHVTGQKPEWNVNASDFEYAMSIVGTMSVNGKLSEDAEDILAAYANGRLVGVCSPKYYERYDAYYLMMTVYGDSVVGDKLTFKIFDASTGINYPVVTSSKDIIFRQGALEGNMTAPVSFVAADKREQQIDLKAGWNWMSMNVVPDALSTNSIFADLDHDTKIVKSKTDGFMKENDANMSVQNMYKVCMGKSSVLTLTGASVDVANTPVSVNSGWNWIGYLPQTSMDVNSALADLDAQNGDVIKSQTQFALYDGYEWVGSLEYLRPGSGYVYLSNADSTISFKYPQSSVMGADNSKSGSDLNFVVNDALFSGNMTMIAKVMDGLSELDNVEVGVFAGDVCRGAARAKDGKYYLTIAGNEQPDALKFRIYFIDADSIVEIDQNLKYAEDAMIGFDSPYIIQLGDDVVVSSVAVCTMPIKTQYVVGENLDLTGGSISVSYSNAAVDTLDMLASMVSGYDKTIAGVQTLEVAFRNVSTTMQVIVNEKKIEKTALLSISFVSLPDRTVYNIGDALDVAGGKLKAVYSDGTADTIDLVPEMVSGFNCAFVGLQSLVVMYSNVATTYQVSVVNPLDVIADEANVKIYGNNRVIIVEPGQICDSDIKVFNIEGRMVMIQKSAGTRTEVPMERQGVYIVKFGNTVERVVLY